MLKIRDEVDLKELEKFGFKYEKMEYVDEYILRKKINGRHTHLLVADFDREVSGDCLDVVYDLIEANVIEKVVK